MASSKSWRSAHKLRLGSLRRKKTQDPPSTVLPKLLCFLMQSWSGTCDRSVSTKESMLHTLRLLRWLRFLKRVHCVCQTVHCEGANMRICKVVNFQLLFFPTYANEKSTWDLKQKQPIWRGKSSSKLKTLVFFASIFTRGVCVYWGEMVHFDKCICNWIVATSIVTPQDPAGSNRFFPMSTRDDFWGTRDPAFATHLPSIARSTRWSGRITL